MISDRKTAEARELCNQLIYNQMCGIYIHDNDDKQQNDSIACSVQSLNVPLDLASLLISRGLVQHKSHSNRKFDEAVDSKRIRKQSDEPITKSSLELQSFENFQEFYRAHKAKHSLKKASDSRNTSDIDDDNRIFDIFKPLSGRVPPCENAHVMRTNAVVGAAAPHPIVDRITEHFKLMTMKRSVFQCRCACIIGDELLSQSIKFVLNLLPKTTLHP